MKKVFISVGVLLLTLIINPHIQAQESRPESWSFQCVDFVHCAESGDKNQACDPIGNDAAHTSGAWSHRAQLFMDRLNFAPNSEVLVTECIDAGIDLNDDGQADPVCTTGDSTQDKILFCGSENPSNDKCDHFSLLQRSEIGYNFDKSGTGGVYHKINGIFQSAIAKKIAVDASGKSVVPAVEWEGNTGIGHMIFRKYIAYSYLPPDTTPTPVVTDTAGPTVAVGIGGQQQGTLTFPTAGPSPTAPPAVTSDCHGEAWDPYGRVFDMKSLEPIPMTQVLLKQKMPDGTFDSEYAKSQNPLIFNPFPTNVFGGYVFYVRDGDYSLIPTKAGYTQPALAQQSELSPFAKSIYSDLYYSDSLAIRQRGAIQHRDIPMMPDDGIGKSYALKILTEEEEVRPDGKMIYRGQTSHPFAELVVEVCRNENGIETCDTPTVYGKKNGGPDKDGKFEVILNPSTLQVGEYYGRTFRKVDLTSNTVSQSIFEQVFNAIVQVFAPPAALAQETGTETKRVAIQPIVQYLEGYAYDKFGKLMPNAVVSLYIPMSERPVYETVANDQGYYRITSEYIPNITYTIGYSVGSEPASTMLTTSQFLMQNKPFIEAEKIDPYKAVTVRTNPRRTIAPTYVPPAQIAPLPNAGEATSPAPVNQNQNAQTPATTAKTQSPNIMILAAAILLLLLAAVGAFIGVYMYKKRAKEKME